MCARLTFVLLSFVAAACGGKDSPTPTTTTQPANVGAPTIESPADGDQLDTLRPTLTVRNATADQAGTRIYEFQISDSATFTSATTSSIVGFAATMGKSGVPEGSEGRTAFTPDQDLQP